MKHLQAAVAGLSPAIAVFIAILLFACTPANAQEHVLSSFGTFTGDSENPIGDVAIDGSGNIYGATFEGGAFDSGSVFELSPPSVLGGPWTKKVLYSFTGGADGDLPSAGVILDSSGSLYGTTEIGGTSGVVYKLTPPAVSGDPWTESVIYNFTGENDGAIPLSTLVFDKNGNLYGTTQLGGSNEGGTVFELSPPAISGDPWTETVLYAFTASHFSFQYTHGCNPHEGVIFGPAGALYGTTEFCGAGDNGVVYKLAPPTDAGNSPIRKRQVSRTVHYNPAMARYTVLLFLTAILTAQSEVEITAEPHHHLILSNHYIRAFSVDVAPHSETLMHRHRHDYIFVTLGDTQVVNAVKGKDPITLTLHDGDTALLSAPFAHIARNSSDQPFRNVTIELLQDEKLHQAPAHWDAANPDDDRGLQILDKGTQEILWYKDGVRASLIDLEPEGTLPTTDPAHPRLVVALHDCDLTPTRAETPSHDPSHHQMQNHDHMEHDAQTPSIPAAPALHLKSGEVHWLPATDSHALTNSGHSPAKFVTLEFQ